MPKQKEITLSRESAYIYLKTLLTMSEEFRGAVEQLRELLNINPFAKQPSYEDDPAGHILYTKKHSGGHDPTPLTNEAFREFCEHFFIPKHLQAGMSRYITLNDSSKLLPSYTRIAIPLPSSTSNQAEMQPQSTNPLAPLATIQIPMMSSKEEMYNIYKDLKDKLDEFGFYRGFATWKQGWSFDRALCAYRLHQQGHTGKELHQELRNEKVIGKKEVFEAADILKWIRKIEVQIKSLEHETFPVSQESAAKK